MYKKIVLSSLVAGALLAINGCGGGGSTPDTVVEPAVLKGVAVDDLILNGVVTATDTDSIALATGRTSTTDGTYTINVNYTGVVLLNVTCDENSTMYNPETNITTACGADVSLNSLGTVTAGTDLTLNISPLTEIVYQRAEALADGNISNVDPTDVEDARTEIGLMFSVDPLADDPTADTYADIIGTIHTLADEDNETSVIDITNLLAAELADGEADGTADDTLSSLVEVMADENLTNNLVDTNGTYIPPENPADLSDIDAAKELFDELRTQAMSVTNYTNIGTPGFLDEEALDMEEALNGVVLNTSYMTYALNFILDVKRGAEYSNLPVTTEPISPTRSITLNITGPGTFSYIINETTSDNTWTGTVSYPDINGAKIYTFTTLNAEINGNLPLDFEPVVVTGIEDRQSFNGSITVNKTTTGASIEISGTVASNETSITLSNTTAELAYDENTTTGEPILNYFKLNGVTLQGIVGGYKIDGSVTVNKYVQNAGLATQGGIYEVTESGFGVYFYCTDFTTYYTPVNVSGVTFTYDGITYQPSGYSSNSVWFDFIAADIQENDILPNLDYIAACASGQIDLGISNNWNDSYMEIANNGWLPNDITFAGKISKTEVSIIEGTLNAIWKNAATMDLESDIEMPLVDVTLEGTLQIPDRPKMLMELTFENNATHNTLGATYTYDTTVINASGVFDTDMLNGDVAITTHTGLRADIEVSNELIVYGGTSTVTKDGLLLGEFEEREGLPVIKYIDGSFESIF